MAQEAVLSFADVRLDLANACVWRGEQAIKVTPTAFALLHYLAAHPGRLITKDELLEAVWPQTTVTEGVLTTHVRQIRRALGDEVKAPRYLETVHRRGYRWIAAAQSSRFQVQSSKLAPAPSFVGREVELAQLHAWLEKALSGERQFVFVTGEAGIGKTMVVEAFVASLKAKRNLWIGRGQCIEHYGPGEAYLPVLEALGRLCREPGGKRLIELLHQHAPTWLVQMPALLSATELEVLQRKTQGTSRERMLRELAEALEALTTEQPLVFWLEDLHWSDVSTLDWLALVARRQEPVRLLVIGTYRPADVIVHEHPLKAVKQELRMHGQCVELPLGFLTEEHVVKYLAVRFPVGATGRLPLQRLARVIHQRTDGNPLFMVNMVDYLVTQKVITQVDGGWALHDEVAAVESRVPESLQQLIEQQLERLSPEERRVLEAASVAGAEFSAAAVAAGIEAESSEIEEQCAGLVRRGQFLRANGAGEWPDGTVAARYEFIHALYRSVLYEGVTARRRQRLHQRIGEREEAAYSEQAREIAAELAVHFERGREYKKAVQYLQQAGENAMRRSAYQEAISLLTRGLELLKTLPDTPERAQQELRLQIALSAPLGMTKGFAASEMEKVHARAWKLCQQIGKTPQLFPVLRGLWGFYLIRAELQTARELAEQFLHLAQSAQDPALLLAAYSAQGTTLCRLGELTAARVHFEQGIARYGPQQYRSYALSSFAPGEDLSWTAWVLWFLGYPDQALKRSHEALTLGQEASRPFGLAAALNFAAALHQLRREAQAVQERAEATIALSTEQGFALLLSLGTILRGWALAEQGQGEEGIAQIRQGVSTNQATGAATDRPYSLALLAEAYGKVGQLREGLSVLAEALAMVQKTGERYYEAELYRLKGTLTLKSKVQGPKSKVENSLESSVQSLESEAEGYFLKAIEIARRQSAKSWELRAVMSLSRLWQQQGKKKQARRMLAEIYGWFTEGFDTADLREAKALLEALQL